ncbi:hypothetical protein [Streptomyces bicolor]|nr:hypothetical protein [Streptomyces bicolor]
MQQEQHSSSLPVLHTEDVDAVTLGRDMEGYREGALEWVRI